MQLLIYIYRSILSFLCSIFNFLIRTKNNIIRSFWSCIDRIKRSYYWVKSLRRRFLNLLLKLRKDLIKFVKNLRLKIKEGVRNFGKLLKSKSIGLKNNIIILFKETYHKFKDLNKLNKCLLIITLITILSFVILIITILYDIHTENLRGASDKWKYFTNFIKTCKIYLKTAVLFLLYYLWMTLILLFKLLWFTFTTLALILYNIICLLFINFINCSKFFARALRNLCIDFYEHGTVALFRAAISAFYFTKDFTVELAKATARKSIDLYRGTCKFVLISHDFTVNSSKTVAAISTNVSQTIWEWLRITFNLILWFVIKFSKFVVYFFNEWAYDWIKFTCISLYKTIYTSLHIVLKFMSQVSVSTYNFTVSFISNIYNGTFMITSFIFNFFIGFTGATRGIANGLVFVIRGIFSTIVFFMESTIGIYSSTMRKYNNIRELIFLFAISLFCVYCSSLAYDRQLSKDDENEGQDSEEETFEKLYPVPKSKLMPSIDNPMIDESDTDSELGFKDEVPDVNTETNSTDDEL